MRFLFSIPLPLLLILSPFVWFNAQAAPIDAYEQQESTRQLNRSQTGAQSFISSSDDRDDTGLAEPYRAKASYDDVKPLASVAEVSSDSSYDNLSADEVNAQLGDARNEAERDKKNLDEAERALNTTMELWKVADTNYTTLKNEWERLKGIADKHSEEFTKWNKTAIEAQKNVTDLTEKIRQLNGTISSYELVFAPDIAKVEEYKDRVAVLDDYVNQLALATAEAGRLNTQYNLEVSNVKALVTSMNKETDIVAKLEPQIRSFSAEYDSNTCSDTSKAGIHPCKDIISKLNQANGDSIIAAGNYNTSFYKHKDAVARESALKFNKTLADAKERGLVNDGKNLEKARTKASSNLKDANETLQENSEPLLTARSEQQKALEDLNLAIQAKTEADGKITTPSPEAVAAIRVADKAYFVQDQAKDTKTALDGQLKHVNEQFKGSKKTWEDTNARVEALQKQVDKRTVKGGMNPIIIYVIVGLALLCLVAVAVGFFVYRKKRLEKQTQNKGTTPSGKSVPRSPQGRFGVKLPTTKSESIAVAESPKELRNAESEVERPANKTCTMDGLSPAVQLALMPNYLKYGKENTPLIEIIINNADFLRYASKDGIGGFITSRDGIVYSRVLNYTDFTYGGFASDGDKYEPSARQKMSSKEFKHEMCREMNKYFFAYAEHLRKLEKIGRDNPKFIEAVKKARKPAAKVPRADAGSDSESGVDEDDDGYDMSDCDMSDYDMSDYDMSDYDMSDYDMSDSDYSDEEEDYGDNRCRTVALFESVTNFVSRIVQKVLPCYSADRAYPMLAEIEKELAKRREIEKELARRRQWVEAETTAREASSPSCYISCYNYLLRKYSPVERRAASGQEAPVEPVSDEPTQKTVTLGTGIQVDKEDEKPVAKIPDVAPPQEENKNAVEDKSKKSLKETSSQKVDVTQGRTGLKAEDNEDDRQSLGKGRGSRGDGRSKGKATKRTKGSKKIKREENRAWRRAADRIGRERIKRMAEDASGDSESEGQSDVSSPKRNTISTTIAKKIKSLIKKDKLSAGAMDELIAILSYGVLCNEKLILHFDDICKILDMISVVFEKEARLIEMGLPATVVTDIHGRITTLLQIFASYSQNGVPGYKIRNFVFCGDYVDRGDNSCQVAILLFLLKLRHPLKVGLLRGNHEDPTVNATYGFEAELQQQFGRDKGPILFGKFTEVFARMPLVARLDKRILAMHGGLPEGMVSLDEINEIPNVLYEPRKHKFACQLLWNDPGRGVIGFAPNVGRQAKGANPKDNYIMYYGEDVVYEWCDRFGLDMIVRGHQPQMPGYRFFAGDKLITLFSAYNYEKNGNLGATIDFEKNGRYGIRVFIGADKLKENTPEAREALFRLVHDPYCTINHQYLASKYSGIPEFSVGVAKQQDDAGCKLETDLTC